MGWNLSTNIKGSTGSAGTNGTNAPINLGDDCTEFGFKAWSFDPISSTAIAPVGKGQIYGTRVRLLTPQTISNISLFISAVGVTLTAGTCYAGIYTTAGVQKGVTADQSTLWTVLGVKIMPITPVALSAGDYYVCFTHSGTTMPQFRGSNQSAGILNATGNTVYRAMTADASTTLPSTLGTINGYAVAWWAGLT